MQMEKPMVESPGKAGDSGASTFDVIDGSFKHGFNKK
jgi:hypothetical protein